MRLGLMVSVLALLTTGCLESGSGSSSASAPPVTTTPANTVQAVQTLSDGNTKCNNGNQGSLVYNLAQSQFFVCNDSQWNAINLQGPAGLPGAAGPQGPAGVPGAAGAPGQNFISGSGAGGLSLKDGTQVMGFFMQFMDSDGCAACALIQLPNGDLIGIDLNSGQFTGTPVLVYYTGPDCMGDAYVGPNLPALPNVVERIYVGNNNAGLPARYFHGDKFTNKLITYNSYRDYETYKGMDQCHNQPNETMGGIVQVSEMQSPPKSLVYLAPIKFTP